MSHASENPVRCRQPDCPEEFPGSRWAQIRAAQKGWFFPREGKPYCPAHVPGWVAEWRAGKAAGK